ncbi:hypothetical protein Patl1_00235 [Pistacia atlantica]|uniref:Uncharacterized protein n=1 Tax=Pistacia atlantica TaxID=434234 RepID=A0ACC1C8D3_9ROSI|nr:hypothetical protein Patl1_00235 [Pistacia atlantica]
MIGVGDSGLLLVMVQRIDEDSSCNDTYGWYEPALIPCKEYWYSREQELNERKLKLLYYSLPTMGLNSYKIQTCS